MQYGLCENDECNVLTWLLAMLKQVVYDTCNNQRSQYLNYHTEMNWERQMNFLCSWDLSANIGTRIGYFGITWHLQLYWQWNRMQHCKIFHVTAVDTGSLLYINFVNCFFCIRYYLEQCNFHIGSISHLVDILIITTV